MKKPSLLIAAILLNVVCLASESAILIDFGTPAANPTLGGTWNTTQTFNQQINLVDTGNNATPVNLRITTSNDDNTSTQSANTWANGDKLWVDDAATSDYIWQGSGTITVTLSGLDNNLTYDLSLVAVRSTSGTGNRIGTYHVQGLSTSDEVSGTGYNSHTGWDNRTVLNWRAMSPVSGEIVVTATANTGHTVYLNALKLTAMPGTTPPPSGNIAVDDDFDNGRIEVVSIDQANRIITTRIPADNHTQDSRMRFWHMRITGLTPGEGVTLRHSTSVDMHYVYSYDAETWHRFPTRGVSNLSFTFTQPTVFIAPNIPYPYGRSLELAAELDPNPHVTVSDLATSEQGRAVKLLRITDASVPDAGKRTVWVQGRQHAFESPSSLPPEGLARWMASDDPTAAAFRRRAIAYVIPIMDVDNVFHGMSGKDMPNDFNRSWQADPAPWNAIAAAKTLLQNLKAGGHDFVGFVDSHDPYYNQGSQWYVATSQANWDNFRPLFLQGVAEAGGTNRHNMFIESFSAEIPTDIERSRDYARFHLSDSPDFIALTLESSHHKDSDGAFMVEEGYLEWGEALGRAFYQYIGGDGVGFSDWEELDDLPADQRGPDDSPANDGVSNLMKYALGVPPLQSAGARLPSKVVEGQGDDEGFPVVSYIRVIDRAGIIISVEVCADLQFVEELGSIEVGAEDLSDGTERVTVRSNATFASQNRQFFRLKVTEI